jgi:hypothetical protein
VATVVEFIASVTLDRLERGERTPVRDTVAYVLIGMGAIAAALGGLVSNVAATALPAAIRPLVITYVAPLLVVVTVLTVVLAIALYRLSTVLRVPPDNRTALLRRVQTRYTSRLRDALGEAARIDLGLREDPRAVTLSPWRAGSLASTWETSSVRGVPSHQARPSSPCTMTRRRRVTDS